MIGMALSHCKRMSNAWGEEWRNLKAKGGRQNTTDG